MASAMSRSRLLTVQVPEQFSSRVIDNVTRRKGEILNIEQKSDRTVLEFTIPARGIIGLRNTLLTATEGEAIIAHRFKGYEPFKGADPDAPSRLHRKR